MKIYLVVLIQFFLAIDLFGQTHFQINHYPLEKGYSIVSQDSAKILFNLVKNSSIFEFSYTRGGCDFRAHAAYVLLQKAGVKTFKVWHFPANKLFIAGSDPNAHRLLLSVEDKINLSTDGPSYKSCNDTTIKEVYWGYHVAPVVLVQSSSKIDTLVIDPALFDFPVNLKVWTAGQVQAKATTYFTFLDGKFISFQTESQFSKSIGTCADCSGNDIITGLFFTEEYSIQQKWIEASLAQGRVFIEYYKNEIAPMELKLKRYSDNPLSSDAIRLACTLAEKKKIISSESDKTGISNVLKLPNEYQKRYELYVKLASKVLFDK